MKRILAGLLVVAAAGIAYAADECVKKEKEFYDTKFYNECYCATLSYPDVEKAMAEIGVDAEPRWVVCTTLDDEKWCQCGVSLSWKDRPEEHDACVATRKKVNELTEKFVAEKENFGVSAPLTCR